MPELRDPAPNGVGSPGDADCVKTKKAQENFYLQSELQNFTWVIILQDGNSKVGASRSASFQLPQCLSENLLQVGLSWMMHPHLFAWPNRVALQCNSFVREWNLAKLTQKCSLEQKKRAKAAEPLII